jgi:hypothetical protein
VICLIPALIDLEVSVGDLYWTPNAWRLLVGWVRLYAPFFLPFGFRRDCPEAVLFVVIMEHVFEFHGEVRGRERHGGRGLRTSNGGSCLRGDEQFSW